MRLNNAMAVLLMFSREGSNFKIISLASELHGNVLVPRLPIFKDPRLYPVYDNLMLEI